MTYVFVILACTQNERESDRNWVICAALCFYHPQSMAEISSQGDTYFEIFTIEPDSLPSHLDFINFEWSDTYVFIVFSCSLSKYLQEPEQLHVTVNFHAGRKSMQP